MVASLMVWCWRKTSSGEWPRYSAVLATILLLNEAFLGALLVVFDHMRKTVLRDVLSFYLCISAIPFYC